MAWRRVMVLWLCDTHARALYCPPRCYLLYPRYSSPFPSLQPVPSSLPDYTSIQIKKTGVKEEPKSLKEENKDLSDVIARGMIRLPEIEGYPFGPERPAQLNYALENNDAALLITCYGREGGPVAAKK